MENLSDLLRLLAGAPALVGSAVTALVIFLTSDRRLSLPALLIQYLLVALALTRFVEPEVAVVKAVVGTLATWILSLGTRRLQERHLPEEAEAPTSHYPWFRIGWLEGPLGLPLRLLTVLLVVLTIIRLFGSYRVPLVPVEVAVVACWMGAMGIAGLVLSGDPLRVAVAFLTILAGFDLVYASVEKSLAVAGAFGAFNLLAALAFSYLTAVHGSGELQPGPEEDA